MMDGHTNHGAKTMTDQNNNAETASASASETASDLINEVGDEVGAYASAGATGGAFDSAVVCLDDARACYRRGDYTYAAQRAERALSWLYPRTRR